MEQRTSAVSSHQKKETDEIGTIAGAADYSGLIVAVHRRPAAMAAWVGRRPQFLAHDTVRHSECHWNCKVRKKEACPHCCEFVFAGLQDSVHVVPRHCC